MITNGGRETSSFDAILATSEPSASPLADVLIVHQLNREHRRRFDVTILTFSQHSRPIDISSIHLFVLVR